MTKIERSNNMDLVTTNASVKSMILNFITIIVVIIKKHFAINTLNNIMAQKLLVIRIHS